MGIVNNILGKQRVLKRFTRIEILHRFAILEQFIPCFYDKGNYQISVSFDAANRKSLQSEAQLMLNHVGLHCYHPIVEYVSLPSGVAGEVELNNNPSDHNLHIKVSQNVMGVDRRVLAIMAHEICHKVLQFYKFPILTGLENEYCTDLATFFVGFGDLTIDGFEKVSFDGMYITTQRIGYLAAQTLYLAQEIINGKKNNMFSDYFLLICPYCNHKSSKGIPNLYGKHIKCPSCKKEFVFDKYYILKHSNSIANDTMQVVYSFSERGIGWIKHFL